MMTVNELVDRVVSDIDDGNRMTLSPATDILPALQQAWEESADIVASRMEQFLTASVILPASDLITDLEGNLCFLIPEDCHQMRVLKVEFRERADSNEEWCDVGLIKATESNMFEPSVSRLNATGVPSLQRYQLGRKFVLTPTTSAARVAQLRVRYVRRPAPLALSQGRITNWDAATGRLVVDAIGAGLSMIDGALGNYINIIDGGTGEIVSTHQVSYTEGSQGVYISAEPTRAIYRDLPVTGALPTKLQHDDYICVAPGTCVPYIEDPVTTFMITYAVSKMNKKLRIADAASTDAAVNSLEKKIGDMAHNRPTRFRVKMSAPWSYRR